MSYLSQTQAYAQFYAAMTQQTVGEIVTFLADDVIFTDPFNSLRGPDALVATFDHMYAVMTKPHFEILDVAASHQAGYIKWRMTGTLKSWPSFSIDLKGMSEVQFNKAGLIVAHHDHWDSAHQLLARLPGAGWFIRRLLTLFALPSQPFISN